MRTLSVVGAGVIGMSVAWRAAVAGWDVRLHDPAPGRGASWVAGGMLAPLTEGLPGEDAALRIGSLSLERWPGFAADLELSTGVPSGLRPGGTLVVGMDQADLDELKVLASWLTERGRAVTMRNRRELRSAESLLSQGIEGGLDVPGDLAVDNRALLAALNRVCRLAGVTVETQSITDVAELTVDADPGRFT